ncbi:ras-domain-containing protein [Lindgomyces ingoldianus]|uniref:Ras-domain-containing protein n=1 Tax=Lindgomyces ingoldianus TaxID=673940 RepID=A0ACB6QB02_9PLEO|nr:ras-domain-containing protein [Lindgomyces ingoldianus]KAF2463326.1 ras-domain-containing protein [Lindgomyces ingoldianus]
MSSRFLREYKIVVVGGGGVGKSAFIIQFVGGYFLSELDPTIEDSYRKQYSVDSEVVLFDILDTAGQEEYSAMREQYMRTCEGMIIMYSITSRVSFEEAFAFREQLLRVKERDYFPMLVVGNKSDQHSEREVPVQEGMAFATHAGCGFLEVSAKSCNNVDRTFFDIVREIRRFNKELPSSLSIPSKLPQTHRKRSPFSPRSLSISVRRATISAE